MTTMNSSCLNCVNLTYQPETPKVCYPWVAPEFIGKNYTLDDVNSVVMQRNIPGIIFLILCIIVGTLGNCHVLYVFSKRSYAPSVTMVHQRIHVNYRIFILWLSTLGLIECIVVAPLLIVYLVYTVTFPSEFLCKFFRFVLYLIPVAMNLTYISIAVDRYLVICKTFKNTMMAKHSLLMCLATVIVSVILTWPAPILFGRGTTETGIPGLTGYRCYDGDNNSALTLKLQKYFQGILVLFFFVVMFVLLVLFTKVRNSYKGLLRFRRTSRRYSASTPHSLKRDQARQEKQRLWIYGSVTICYVMSALPYHILAILWFTQVIIDCDMSLPEAQGFYLFIWSYFFSPVLNPFIYGFQDDGFRNSVKAMYHKYRRASLSMFEKSSNDSTSETICDKNGFRPGSVFRKNSSTTTDVRPGCELDGILSDMASTTIDVGALAIPGAGFKSRSRV